MAEHNGSGERITLVEAAERSGLSVDLVRRRLKSGHLPSRQTTTKHGPAWEVPADALPLATARVARATVAEDRQPATLALVEMVAKLQADVIARTEAAALWQGRAEMLAGELATSREQVRALMAPREEPENSASVEPISSVDLVDPPARPWWHRLIWGS